jgi:hypothetical protein
MPRRAASGDAGRVLRHRLAAAGVDQGTQAVDDEEGPRGCAKSVALVLAQQADVAEPDQAAGVRRPFDVVPPPGGTSLIAADASAGGASTAMVVMELCSFLSGFWFISRVVRRVP